MMTARITQAVIAPRLATTVRPAAAGCQPCSPLAGRTARRGSRGRPRGWPVSTSTSTLMPTRSGGLSAGVVDAHPHRDALDHLHPVAGGVLRRQQREARGRGRADARRPCPARSRPDRCRPSTVTVCARPHVGELGLLRRSPRPRRGRVDHDAERGRGRGRGTGRAAATGRWSRCRRIGASTTVCASSRAASSRAASASL